MSTRTKEKMHTKDLYLPNNPEIAAEQQKCLELLYDFNHTRPFEGEKRAALMKEMFVISSNVVAIGVPCKVLRNISEHDKDYYFRDYKIKWDEIK